MYDGLKYDVDALRATLRAARLNYGYSEIRATIDGVVSSRDIKLGQTIARNSVAFRITETSELVAYLQIPQSELAKFAGRVTTPACEVDSMPDAGVSTQRLRASARRSTRATARSARRPSSTMPTAISYRACSRASRLPTKCTKKRCSFRAIAHVIEEDDETSSTSSATAPSRAGSSKPASAAVRPHVEVSDGLSDDEQIVVVGHSGTARRQQGAREQHNYGQLHGLSPRNKCRLAKPAVAPPHSEDSMREDLMSLNQLGFRQSWHAPVASASCACGQAERRRPKPRVRRRRRGRRRRRRPGRSRPSPVVATSTPCTPGTAPIEAFAEADVIAKVAGEVREILVEEGDEVTKGQILARLDGDRLRLELNQSEANLRKLQRDYERNVDLKDKGLISSGDFDKIRYEMEALEAVLQPREARTRLHADPRADRRRRLQSFHPCVGNTIDRRRTGCFGSRASIRWSPTCTFPSASTAIFRRTSPSGIDIDALAGQRVIAAVTRVSPIVDPDTGTFKITIEIAMTSAASSPACSAASASSTTSTQRAADSRAARSSRMLRRDERLRRRRRQGCTPYRTKRVLQQQRHGRDRRPASTTVTASSRLARSVSRTMPWSRSSTPAPKTATTTTG